MPVVALPGLISCSYENLFDFSYIWFIAFLLYANFILFEVNNTWLC